VGQPTGHERGIRNFGDFPRRFEKERKRFQGALVAGRKKGQRWSDVRSVDKRSESENATELKRERRGLWHTGALICRQRTTSSTLLVGGGGGWGGGGGGGGGVVSVTGE